MFGICLLHSIGFGPYPRAWAINILSSCVVGFVFISGWFGVDFSVKKLLRLYGVGLYAAAVFGIMTFMMGDAQDWLSAVEIAYRKLVHGFWFLHAYAVMMILSPLVNAALSKTAGGVRDVLPFMLMVWLWGFGRTLPYGDAILPRTDGLEAYGGITLTAVYAAARICRLYGIDRIAKTKWLFMLLPLFWIATGIGLGDYNSPFAFALAATCFVLFKKIRLPAFLGKGILLIAPSMFSVYLIHTNGNGFKFIKEWGCWMAEAGFGSVGTPVITAFVIFALALILDMPRRLLFAIINRIRGGMEV